MNTIHLKYFVEIADSGSINEAALRLYINYSSLIYAINSLEKEIGSKLLIRQKSGISLTEKGKQVYVEAKEILQTISNWSHTNADAVTFLNIEVLPILYCTFFDDIAVQLENKYPNLRLNSSISPKFFAELNQQKKFERQNTILFSGCYESDLYYKEKLFCKEKNLEKIPLFKSDYVLYLNKQHPLAQRDSVCVKDLKPIPIYTSVHKDKDSLMQLNLKEIHYLPEFHQILNTVARHNCGTISLSFVQGFTELVDLDKIAILPIYDYDMTAYISLYYSFELMKDQNARNVIDFISSYPFNLFPGTEPFSL